MLRGRGYLMKIGGKTVTATIAPLKYKLSIDTLSTVAATRLELNEIGVCDLELGRADRVRSLPREPRHRRLHPDRPDHQRHGRRRADPLRPAPLAERLTGRR